MEKIKILVTGARGFIGGSFVDYFSNDNRFEILRYDRFTDQNTLFNHLKVCDYIFNFAGVIKSKRNSDYYKSNVEFVKYLISNCIRLGNKTFKFVYMSSVWVEHSPNSLYGKSKREGEIILQKLANKHGFQYYIYRLNNIFGEKSAPNYGGVIANFCYNISHNIPLEINNPSKEFDFVYIEDLLKSFENIILNKKASGYEKITSSNKINIGNLAKIISGFKKGNKPLNKFENQLFKVYSYHESNLNKIDCFKDVSILVSSCDKYSDAWLPMFKLFSKYGEALTKCPIILNTESLSFRFDGLKIISTGDIKNTSALSWSKRLKFALDQIKTKYVIFLMEDYFLRRPVNCDLISNCIYFMDSNKRIACFNFEPLCKVNNVDKKYFNFCKVPIGTPYRFNAQCALWRVDVFKNSFLDDESPWEWEYFGNMRNNIVYKNMDVFSLSWETQEPFYIDFYSMSKDYSDSYVSRNGIMRGKWYVDFIDDLFKENDIHINYDHLGVYKLPRYKYNRLFKFIAKSTHILRHNKYVDKKRIESQKQRYNILVKPYIEKEK